MPTRATGTFEIDSWDEEPYDEREGTKLARVRVAKTFRGDVEGVSTTDLLLAYGAEEGSAAYVGFERVVGSIHGRSGTFVLHHTATSSPDCCNHWVIREDRSHFDQDLVHHRCIEGLRPGMGRGRPGAG